MALTHLLLLWGCVFSGVKHLVLLAASLDVVPVACAPKQSRDPPEPYREYKCLLGAPRMEVPGWPNLIPPRGCPQDCSLLSCVALLGSEHASLLRRGSVRGLNLFKSQWTASECLEHGKEV